MPQILHHDICVRFSAGPLFKELLYHSLVQHDWSMVSSLLLAEAHRLTLVGRQDVLPVRCEGHHVRQVTSGQVKHVIFAEITAASSIDGKQTMAVRRAKVRLGKKGEHIMNNMASLVG